MWGHIKDGCCKVLWLGECSERGKDALAHCIWLYNCKCNITNVLWGSVVVSAPQEEQSKVWDNHKHTLWMLYQWDIINLLVRKAENWNWLSQWHKLSVTVILISSQWKLWLILRHKDTFPPCSLKVLESEAQNMPAWMSVEIEYLKEGSLGLFFEASLELVFRSWNWEIPNPSLIPSSMWLISFLLWVKEAKPPPSTSLLKGQGYLYKKVKEKGKCEELLPNCKAERPIE